MALALSGVPAQIVNLLQERTLERVFQDALFPRLLFRAEARPEVWPANIGERMVFTRAGLIPVTTRALVPGSDPTPQTYQTEQWEAEARQHGNTLDTHMPSSRTTLASLFLRNTQQLGLNAGQTLNRLSRDPLFRAYLAGEAMLTASTGGVSTQLQVNTLNGFTEQLVNGRISPVSSSNPIPISFSTSEPDNSVVGATPADPSEPNGPGILHLSAATSGAVAARVGVFAATRSRRLRVGGHATVDGLTSSNILTLNDIISAVSRLREMNVPTHPDGQYHVHMTPTAEAEIFQDTHWQNLHQSLPEGAAYRDLAIGQAVGCYFYRNNECPDEANVDATRIYAAAGGAGGATVSAEIGGELTNANGVKVRRVIVTGGGALYEKYIDESQYISEAGVTGKIGQFAVVNNGAAAMTNRIRFILRSPLDRLQQSVSQTWSWSGDFPVPSDALSGDTARYKRAVVIEHA